MRKKLRGVALFMAMSLTLTSFESLNVVKASSGSEVTNESNVNVDYSSGLDDGFHMYRTDIFGNKVEVNPDDYTGNVEVAKDIKPAIKTLNQYYDVIDDALGYENEEPVSVAAPENELPSSVDNTTSMYFPKIGKQTGGSCGCWADVYYTLTNTLNKARNTMAKNAAGYNINSNVFSPEFVYNQTRVSKNTSGGTVADENAKFLVKYGSPSLDKVVISPNSGWADTWNPSEDAWVNALNNRPTSYNTLDIAIESDDTSNTRVKGPHDSSLNVIKKALSDGAVLPFSTYIYSWQNKKIGDGAHKNEEIYYESNLDKLIAANRNDYGSHRMTIVGYDDDIWVDINGDGQKEDAECGAFKIANSWGTLCSFSSTDRNGNKIYYLDCMTGCHWVSYDAVNKVSAVSGVNSSGYRRCIFNQYPRLYTVEEGKEYTAPKYYLTATLNTPARNQIDEFTVYAYKNGSFVSRKTMNEIFERYNFHETDLYGNTSNPQDGTVAFDISDIVSDLNDDNFDDYVFQVKIKENTNDNKELTVKSIYIKNSQGKAIKNINRADKNKIINGSSYTFELTEPGDVEIESLVPSIESGKITETMPVTFTANAYGDNDLEYEFILHHDMDDIVLQNYSSSNSVKWVSKYSHYPTTVTVNVKDSETGKIVSKTIDYKVMDAPVISGIQTAPSKMKLGNSTKLIISNNTVETLQLFRKFEVSCNNGPMQTIYDGKNAIYDWTPAKAGVYYIKYTLYDENNVKDYRESYCVVESDRYTEIYYSNDSWNQAYIHYRTNDGTWTVAPGYRMEQTDGMPGYKWKYVININDISDGVEVCFNNGEGQWDSKNMSNYHLGLGTYKIKNGQIEQAGLSVDANLSRPSLEYRDKINVNVTTTGGKAPYRYEYKVFLNDVQNGYSVVTNADATASYEVSAYAAGNYRIDVIVTDANGDSATVSKTIDIGEYRFTDIKADKTSVKTGEKVKFTVTPRDEILYKNQLNARTWSVYNASGNEVANYVGAYGNDFDFTPTAEGTYTVKCVSVCSVVEKAEISMTFTVKNSNTVKVYYKNNNYSSANIHYQVGNGEWTQVPGVRMVASDRSDYTWMYEIDLGDNTYANVCFNENGNNWDSRNAQNYRVYAGKFAIYNGSVFDIN